jgi:hypothetical protein
LVCRPQEPAPPGLGRGRGDLHLDEHLATVCTIEDGKIRRIETYLSDVDGMDVFFPIRLPNLTSES